MAEIGYVGFSIANIFADSNVKNHLFNFRSTITSQQAGIIGSVWNHLDAVYSALAAATMIYNMANGNVDKHEMLYQKPQAIVLIASSVALAALTITGIPGWGFAIATYADLINESMNFYKAQKEYSDISYWTQSMVSKLQLIDKKLAETSSGNDKNVLQRQKTDILIDIAARYDFENKKQIPFSIRNKVDSAVKSSGLRLWQLEQRGKGVTHDLKKQRNEKTGQFLLKLGSAIGMTLLAIGSAVHPIGFAITLGIAVGYMGCKFYQAYQSKKEKGKKAKMLFFNYEVEVNKNEDQEFYRYGGRHLEAPF
ncbi:hypothetical protein Psal006b_03315 (plasmid) [Piscirickettsia salmonis]|uniref:Uncharacterized protein n=2 Tax=Piscirickettsia salmonis TaxID=1238 RepID=A0A1L6TI43_PISSA|nr:hypothetical protein PSLF89_1p84 [Piscirickettsia salmonis LF-89 = ATCC VR-1361]ALB24695.1 hypothetical protein KU39_3p233 [Piscirickettsia salmonis]ALY04556.1 hypothetical protein AWE47_16760 [Piscirickettsia salmonis]AMA43926.1 hypothetical protein AWJ11_16190 [Piscirickettsia salmonis]AOS37145.1 hypothetical protein AVM72_17520 [Piscirickettsia salmonis]